MFGFYSKYKEIHEKAFPPKGEALRQRWVEFQEAQKAAKKAKESGAAAAQQSQTKTGATVEEVKDEEVKTEEVKESTAAPSQPPAQAVSAPQAQAA